MTDPLQKSRLKKTAKNPDAFFSFSVLMNHSDFKNTDGFFFSLRSAMQKTLTIKKGGKADLRYSDNHLEPVGCPTGGCPAIISANI